MNNLLKKIDSYLLILLIELFLVVTLSIFTSNSNLSILDFIMLCATFFMVMITYIGGIVVGLILCSIIIFIYASYIFYMNLVKGSEIQYMSYIWMISMPLLSFTIGRLSNYISQLQKLNLKLIQNHKNLVTIDVFTSYASISLFW